MNAIDLSRRNFIVGAGVAAGGLTLGFDFTVDQATGQGVSRK